MKRVQCKKVTNKGVQCLYKSLYCLIHQPREVWPSLIFSFLLGFISGYLANYIFYKKSLKDDLINRHISQQRYVPPAINGFPVIIADGTNSRVVTKPASFTSMIPFSPFVFRVDKEGIIEIYGEIRYPDDTIVVLIHKDQVIMTPISGIDINSDLKALEIVDSDRNPVFQLSVVPYEQWKEQETKRSQNHPNKINEILPSRLGNPEEVVLFYYVNCEGNAWWCVTPAGSQRVDNRESMQKWQREIPRLFKYSGQEYPRVRLDSRSR